MASLWVQHSGGGNVAGNYPHARSTVGALANAAPPAMQGGGKSAGHEWPAGIELCAQQFTV